MLELHSVNCLNSFPEIITIVLVDRKTEFQRIDNSYGLSRTFKDMVRQRIS